MDAAIVSGSDAAALDYEEHMSSDDESSSVPCDEKRIEQNAFSNLYDPNGDDEDEAYVYKHMRGGLEEVVKLQQNTNMQPQMDNDTNTIQENPHYTSFSSSLEQMSILKPRHSDAILSCPCCFQIVCMDCQRHEKYINQYRAMFVMNIGVDWNQIVHSDHGQEEPNIHKRIKHDEMSNATNMQQEGDQTDSTPSSSTFIDNHQEATHVYYSVYCLQCKTEVAALGMHDEVYHFFGCLVSG